MYDRPPPPYHCDTAPWKEPAHMHGGLAGPAGATSIFKESESKNGAPALQNCNRRRCAYCIVDHRRPKRAARFGYRIACRGWSNSAGLLCPGPHPRCGTRRFTTRVAQVRAAAAPCRRFKPPNAGDYATPPWHLAVAWLKETHENKTAWTGTRRSQASVVFGRSSGRLPGPHDAGRSQTGAGCLQHARKALCAVCTAGAAQNNKANNGIGARVASE